MGRDKLMKILLINGANLNMLGTREPEKYGNKTLADIEAGVIEKGKELGAEVDTYQSNIEGEIVEKIQQARGKYDGILINAGGYTHTSVVIRDAISAVSIPTIEIHMTNIHSREEFRHTSLLSGVCKGIIAGFGGVLVLRSSIFSVQLNGNNVEVGLISVVQGLLDKIEKKIKHNIAANRICEIYEIMKEIDYETAKAELPSLCICYIDGFSDKDSKDLINAIKEINGNLSNVNKCLQLGREIARYCDVEILKRAIKKLPVLKEGNEEKTMRQSTAQTKDEFETRKEKLLIIK